ERWLRQNFKQACQISSPSLTRTNSFIIFLSFSTPPSLSALSFSLSLYLSLSLCSVFLSLSPPPPLSALSFSLSLYPSLSLCSVFLSLSLSTPPSLSPSHFL